ncbi:MAG: hypothetical protein ABEJ93_03150 [Candidatus Nanohalobium sp.]
MPNSEKVKEAYNYLEDRFGVRKRELEGLKFREVSGDVWLKSEKDSGLESETEGVRALRFMDIGVKPTTYFLQLLDSKIGRNVVGLEEDEFMLLLEDEMIERDKDLIEESRYAVKEKGYVALEYCGRVIGCGFFMDNLVSSRIPEGRASELRESLMS